MNSVIIFKMSCNKKIVGEDTSQFRKYDLNFEQIPRLHYLDPLVDELISQNKPVVITDSILVKPAVDKWNLEYLEKNLSNNTRIVYASNDHKFKYYDEKKMFYKCYPYGVNNNSEFTPPTKRIDMHIRDFMKSLKEWKPGYDRLYLQQSMNSSFGQEMVDDFINFDWEFINGKKKAHNWGPLTSNLLLISMEGNVTPCHYDEQENFFAQVMGVKRCILFPPSDFESLYPHPVHHPHDRQSMVDFDKPDYTRFPKFKSAKGVQTLVYPGDVLYIPIYWWHHVESLLRGGPTVSMNFWYKACPTALEYPLKDHQKVAIMRNIEKMLQHVLQDPRDIGPLLRTLVASRYTSDNEQI